MKIKILASEKHIEALNIKKLLEINFIPYVETESEEFSIEISDSKIDNEEFMKKLFNGDYNNLYTKIV